MEYFGDGDRVVMLGNETFRVRASGVTHRAEWAWVIDMHDGLITRIVAIQDLSRVAEPVGGSSIQGAIRRQRKTVVLIARRSGSHSIRRSGHLLPTLGSLQAEAWTLLLRQIPFPCRSPAIGFSAPTGSSLPGRTS
jgi:hypothetical protein